MGSHSDLKRTADRGPPEVGYISIRPSTSTVSGSVLERGMGLPTGGTLVRFLDAAAGRPLTNMTQGGIP